MKKPKERAPRKQEELEENGWKQKARIRVRVWRVLPGGEEAGELRHFGLVFGGAQKHVSLRGAF